MFVDTSVLVAIMANEPDGPDWVDRIVAGTGRMTSPLVLLECTMRLTTLLAIQPKDIEQTLRALLRQLDIHVIAIEDADTAVAIDAFARYGKGRSHSARLNLADCLSYACAKRRGLRLLYKGNDFAKTDIG